MSVITGMNVERVLAQEPDGCCGCRYELEPADNEPCKICRNNYLNKWEPKPKAKEFTADELIRIFRDAFVERRAIGILDIENKVKELFE